MNITSRIKESTIDKASLIQSNNFAEYWFIDASIAAQININSVNYDFEFQTGHSFHLNDYSLPGNCLSIYDNEVESFISLIDSNSTEIENEDEDIINEINEEKDTSFNSKEFIEILKNLRELRSKAEQVITEAEQEAEERLNTECKEDTLFYVSVEQYEMQEVEDNVFKKMACGRDELFKFDSENEAKEFVEEKFNSINDHDYATIISSKDARVSFEDQFESDYEKE